jgi:CheY-like chemotaxis protein
LALIEAYLEPFELKIEKVKNGIDLLKMAIEIKPSLIITDIKMPLLDGHKAAKKLSEIRETLNIPVIGISATQKNKMDLIYFDSYLEKPVERNVIIEEISLYLKHKIIKVDAKKRPVFILEDGLGEIEKKIILKIKIIFEKNLELQNITDLESACMGIKEDIHDNKLNNLMPWFENFLIEIGTFQLDLVNENSKMALSEIYKFLK